MSQQGGWGGQSPQGGPQQPGYGPGPGAQGYPQPGQGYQPQPGAYNPQYPPQQGQGYPQQPAYGAQGQPQGYGQQPGFPSQSAAGGGYGPPGGYQPTGMPPAKGGSAVKIIGIVVVALVVLGLIGGLLSVLAKPKTPAGPVAPSTVPTVAAPTPTGTRSSAAPTPAPSTSATSAATSAKPSASASAGPTTGTAGAPLVIGQGISVAPQSGWTVVKQEADFLVLKKDSAVFLAETGKVKPGTTGVQVVDSYLASQAEELSNVKKSDTTALDIDPGVSVGKGLQVGTMTGSSGSQTMAFGAVASVRVADGVTFVGTLVWPAAEDVAPYNADYTKMISSMLSSQLKK